MSNLPRPGAFTATSPSGPHRIAYADWGEPAAARVVLCCHGLTRNGRDFDALARRLAEEPNTRVICPDVAGRGRSDWLKDPAEYGYPLYIADMAALIASLGVKQVDWIGTSMGGLIGMFLAAAPDTPVRSLIMNDVGPVLPRAALERIAGYVGRDERFGSLGALEAHLRQVHAPFGPLSAAQWAHLAEHGHRRRADGSYGLAYDPAIGVNLRQAVQDWDFREAAWDKIAAPALVLRGALSDLLSAEVAAEMTSRGPKAELATFEGIGHAPALMAEDQIETVRRWLARHN
ncbi:MAG TPA: alpha/beta hydrolase [Dongiaceae bacterium]|nr:alpha/beta hydrolase [Dongiaceae bacterium]